MRTILEPIIEPPPPPQIENMNLPCVRIWVIWGQLRLRYIFHVMGWLSKIDF